MDYFDESYTSKNGRWDIDIKKISNEKIHVSILSNSFNNAKYPTQTVVVIDKYGIDVHPCLPKYVKKELIKIKEKYFS